LSTKTKKVGTPKRPAQYNGSGPWKLPEVVRAMPANYELRTLDDHPMPVLTGHFAVFDQWTEINSALEGHFLERLSKGSLAKSIKERGDRIRVLFNHGRDYQIGDKVLGPLAEIGEDEIGGRYSVPLLDTSYNRDLIPGLEAGLYGSSFRFRVVREQVDKKPARSQHNPEGLPERTVKELALYELGPVTWPAYESTTAGVRSLTDRFMQPKYISADAANRRVALLERISR
jgi:HK97 family phage prohead protease